MDMRKMIALLGRDPQSTNLLREFEDLLTGGKPPVILPDERGGDGPKGGKFWFKGGKKIALKQNEDFATAPLMHWHEFGFDPNETLAWLEDGHAHVAQSFRRLLDATAPELGVQARNDHGQQHWRKNPSLLLSFLSAREASLALSLGQGWAFIEYDVHAAVLWFNQAFSEEVVATAGDLFPLTTMETITVETPSSKTGAFPFSAMALHREDHPGFAGAFAALMKWATHGITPEQNWLYILVPPHDHHRVDERGVHPDAGQYVTTGNWTERNVYALRYYFRRVVLHLRNSPGTLYRFPSSVAKQLGLQSGGDVPTLISKHPFVIPADQVQVKTAAGWAPLQAA